MRNYSYLPEIQRGDLTGKNNQDSSKKVFLNLFSFLLL